MLAIDFRNKAEIFPRDRLVHSSVERRAQELELINQTMVQI